MYRTVVAAIAIAVIAGSLGTPRAAADNAICGQGWCSFLSPSRNIGCELDYQRGSGIPDQVYCQSDNSPQSVTMSSTGVLKTCTGETCLGNSGQGTPTLAYGQSAEIGPFTCRSEAAGMTCTVTSGRGFTISNSAITPVG